MIRGERLCWHVTSRIFVQKCLASNRVPGSLMSSGAALSPRRATHLFLLRQNKVSQKKATLVPASLRFATGSLWCSVQPGSRSNSLRFTPLRQSRALIRLALRSSAHSQGVGGRGSGSDSGSGSCPACATIFIAVCARITSARGRNGLTTRRVVWFLGSDRNFAAKHPQGAPKARRIWALTQKTPESKSPFCGYRSG